MRGGGERRGCKFLQPCSFAKIFISTNCEFRCAVALYHVFQCILRFSQLFHSRLTIRDERYGYNREFKQRRFLSTQVNRRWTFFALLNRDFEQIFEQIVSIKVNTLSNTVLVARSRIKREKGLTYGWCVSLKKRRCLNSISRTQISCWRSRRRDSRLGFVYKSWVGDYYSISHNSMVCHIL